MLQTRLLSTAAILACISAIIFWESICTFFPYIFGMDLKPIEFLTVWGGVGIIALMIGALSAGDPGGSEIGDAIWFIFIAILGLPWLIWFFIGIAGLNFILAEDEITQSKGDDHQEQGVSNS